MYVMISILTIDIAFDNALILRNTKVIQQISIITIHRLIVESTTTITIICNTINIFHTIVAFLPITQKDTQ